MEFEGDKLRIGRKLSRLDRMVMDFTSELEAAELDYVIVNGYVAILMGRSRGSEDIDILVDMESEEFESLWERLEEAGYWCINAGEEEAWKMLQDDLSIRFAEKGKSIPNFEVFVPGDSYERAALEGSLEVQLDGESLEISPLELQIVYKLVLGSEKDFEDALHIYTVAGENLEEAKLDSFADKMGVEDELGELRTEAEK